MLRHLAGIGMTALCLAGPAGVSATAGPTAAGPEPVPLWGRWEAAFVAETDVAPEAEVTVELTAPSGRRESVTGFWDGGRVWRARFMPHEEGTWRYRTRAQPPVAGLNGREGSFRVRRLRGTANRFLRHGPIRVAASGRHLEHADGTPFFWLGDTAWNGPLRSAEADWETYLRDRAAKQFSAIQFVTTQWRAAPADAEGRVAFTGRERISIDPRFFQRLDRRIDAINAHGLLAVPVLLWAIRGEENPGWALPEDQAIRLARYMISRYGAHHVVWIPAGDGDYTGAAAERWKRIGRALFPGEAARGAGAAGSRRAPVAMHPGGMQWPYAAFWNEPWLDIVGYQSGHGDDARTLAWIHSGPPAREWRQEPARPFLNLEPPYEAHRAYQSRRPHSDASVRRAAWWSVLVAPPAGITYGAHGIWSWETEPREPLNHAGTGIARPWHEAMALPGSAQMGHLVRILTALPWTRLRPAPEWLEEQPGEAEPARFIAVAATEDGAAAIVYLPVGGEVRLRLPAGERRAAWFDPRTGRRRPARAEAPGRFRAPDAQDWLLVLTRR